MTLISFQISIDCFYYQKVDTNEDLDDEALQSPLPYLLEHAYYFEQCGIGLGRDEIYRSVSSLLCPLHRRFFFRTFRIWLSLKQLVDKGQFEKIRFWGKIYGTQKNYYIAEAEQHNDQGGDDDEIHEELHAQDRDKDIDDEELDGEDDPLPESKYKPPPVVPKEERGTGLNKFTYYVCNHREFYNKD